MKDTEIVKEAVEEAIRLTTSEGISPWEMTADQLDEEATRRFLEYGNLDPLGWQHRYQAMNLRNYAKILREQIKQKEEE